MTPIIYTNSFMKEFMPLMNDLQKVCHFGFFIHDELGGKPQVVGIVGKSPSLLRKKSTLKQVEQKIKDNNKSLEVTDSHPDTIMFTIRIK